MLRLVLLVFLVAGVHGFDQTISTDILELGKELFEMVKNKSNLPKYGSCWTAAVERIKQGCKSLTDSIQTELALQLTACFLELSGQHSLPQDCLNERTDALRRLCMSQLPDRTFAVYTEFFTQSLHICYFLQNQVWNSVTFRTIVSLRSNSKLVSEQLDAAKGMQTVLLDYQKQGLDLQKTLLNHGENLSKSLNSSQTRLEQLTVDLNASTQEHMSLLEDLFRQFYLLQNWMVGKHSFLDRLLFYSGALLTIVVVTSTAATQDSRIYLIIILMLNYGAEYMLVNNFELLLRLMPTVGSLEIDNFMMDTAVWQLRKVFVVIALAIFLAKFFTFENVAKRQLKLFQDIQMQNVEILEKLESVLKMRANGEQRHQRSITPTPNGHLIRHSSESRSLTPSRQDDAQNVNEQWEETSRSVQKLCIVLNPIAEEDLSNGREMVEVFPAQHRRRKSLLPSSTRSYSLRNRSVDKN